MEPCVFALTGGIGSGKSTVARVLRESGVAVVDADQVAREVVEPGTPALDEIHRAFGDSVLKADGSLDRAALGSIVFGDASQRERLNQIVHPRVREAVSGKIAALRAKGERLIAYEIPLLYETKQEALYSPVVVVACSVEKQEARTMARDGSTREDARARIAAQMPLREKARRADWVINNDGSLEDLERQSVHVVEQIRAGFVDQ